MDIIRRENFHYYIDHPGTACAICIFERKFVLVKNCRRNRICSWEIPGGIRERSESFEKAVYREILEETGYLPKHIRFLFETTSSLGITNETIRIFICTLINRKQESEHEIGFFSLAEIMDLISEGKLFDFKTILSFLWYKCFIKKSA